MWRDRSWCSYGREIRAAVYGAFSTVDIGVSCNLIIQLKRARESISQALTVKVRLQLSVASKMTNLLENHA
jgi:hypothetical protein